MLDYSLEHVSQEFDKWRRISSNGGRHAIPDHLWHKARSLYPKYSCSQICRTLRISGSQFKHHIRGGTNQHTGGADDVEFVKAKQANNLFDQDVTITLQGQTNRLELNVPQLALPQVISEIGKLL